MPGNTKQGRVPRRRVYFKLEAPEAEEVSVCGSFNNWKTDARPLKQGKKGIWRTHIMLEPGTHEYRFLVDGKWENDPHAERVFNAYGTENSVRTVA